MVALARTAVSDAVFSGYRTLYDYDRGDLAAHTDRTDDSNADWRIERVSFAAAYGGERVPTLLYIPKQGKPPYQTVVFFPGSNALSQRSSDEIKWTIWNHGRTSITTGSRTWG